MQKCDASAKWSRRSVVAGGLGALGAAAVFGATSALADERDESLIPNERFADLGSRDGAGDDGIRRDANGICLMEDWLGSAPEFADEDVDEEVEADIVVIGGGVAGVAAARAAAEAGKSVVLFEKCDSFQSRHGEYAVLGSKFCEENWGRGNADLKTPIIDELQRVSGNRTDQRALNTWADHSGEAFDWFLGAVDDLYVLPTSTTMPPDDVNEWVQPRNLPLPEQFDLDTQHYKCFVQATVQFHPSQSFAFDAHCQKALDTGLLTAYFCTPAKKLIREGNGPVTGVIAQDYDGKVIRANAKAVILAAGDYASDPNMLNYYNPWLRNNGNILYTSIDPEGNFANTGDGDKMGMWIGAKMEEGPHAAQTHNTGGCLGITAFLEVDLRGKRIGNEDVPAQEIDNRLHSLYKNKLYQIFDAAWPEEITTMSTGHCQVSSMVSKELHERNYWLQPSFGYGYESAVEDSVADGKTLKADTLEELVAQFDMDDEARQRTLETIQKYNEAAKAGVDEEFGKNPASLYAIENPPYYACLFDLESVLPIMSGLETDDEFHVLDTEREVIPGLYAAGNNGGGRFSGEYPTTAPGISHGLALTSGMLAGKNAAAAI